MKRPARIVVEVLVLALIAAISTMVYLACSDFGRFSAADIPLLFFVVLAASLIPGVVLTLVIEGAFAVGVDSQKMSALVLSAVTGAVAGFAFLAAAGDTELWTRSMSDYLFTTALGFGCGIMVALLARRFSAHATTAMPSKKLPLGLVAERE